MERRRAALPERRLAKDVIDPSGREVVKIEALPLQTGQIIRLVFEHVQSPWRQGVWIATNGVLQTGKVCASQFVIWSDSAPPVVEICCEDSDGLLRFYNVWDSGRGRRRESLSATSGMTVEDLGDGWLRYGCNDIGTEPNFEKLVFRVSVA